MKILNRQLFCFIIALSSLSLYAKRKSNSCNSLNSCLKYASKLAGQKYIYQDQLIAKNKISFTQPNFITKENADEIISLMLDQNDLARIPLNEKGSFNIIPKKNLRYEAVPVKKSLQDVPKNHDHYSYTFQVKHADADDISMMFRPFMSKYGRLMSVRKGNYLILVDTGLNVHRLSEVINQVDTPLTKEQKEKLEKEQEQNFEIQKIKAKNCKENEFFNK